jgi:hypothetical protein
MNFWKKRGRRTKYTSIGITRVPCVRCGAPAVHQWSICSDGNTYRALCLDCDIELNRKLLEWARCPDVEEKMAAYEAQQRG